MRKVRSPTVMTWFTMPPSDSMPAITETGSSPGNSAMSRSYSDRLARSANRNLRCPISSEIFVDDCEPAHAFDWIKAQFEVLERLRDKARVLCANAVVSLEITLDPFACTDDGERSGVRLSAQGTAVTLELVA